MEKKLSEYFVSENFSHKEFINDYDVFKDKKLLEKIRKDIINKIVDYNKEINNNLIDECISSVLENYDFTILERSHIANLIENEVFNEGPLTDVLKDINVTEIMINSVNNIYIKANDILYKDNSISFINDEHIIRTIDKLLIDTGLYINKNKPILEAKIRNNMYIKVLLPPLTKNPIITIKKFNKDEINLNTLLSKGTLTPFIATYLEASVKANLNILVVGNVDSGKTTILSMLGNFIKNTNRIITIEKYNKINLNQDNIVNIETINKKVDTNIILNNIKSLSPNNIILDEIEPNNIKDVIDLIKSGYNGFIASISSESINYSIDRLVKNIDINDLLVFDLIIEIKKLDDNRRKIVNISEMQGIKNNKLIIKPIFVFKDNKFLMYDFYPLTYKKIKAKNINNLDEFYKKIKKK